MPELGGGIDGGFVAFDEDEIKFGLVGALQWFGELFSGVSSPTSDVEINNAWTFLL